METFPYKIEHDVIERKGPSRWEDAIHSGTGLTAGVQGIKDRGIIREGGVRRHPGFLICPKSPRHGAYEKTAIVTLKGWSMFSSMAKRPIAGGRGFKDTAAAGKSCCENESQGVDALKGA